MKKLAQYKIKPFDFIIIFGLIVLSFLPHYIFATQTKEIDDTYDRYAIVRIDGKEVDRFNLDQEAEMEKTYYPANGQYNIVQIQDGKIRVKEDNSPDQIAVKTSWISKNGQTSICLPHKLVIEITQEGADDAFIN